jgi:hypothetical protein
MERNSLGQFIVNESGSSTVSIKVTEQYISLDQYNRFLLDNKEFTELTTTIDKDALIKELTNQVNSLNGTINGLSQDLKGGFLVSVTNSQYSYPTSKTDAITYNGQTIWENVGFNDDTTSPNFNSRQSNGLKFWNIPNKEATVYSNSNSEGRYDLKSTIKYRLKYIGESDIFNVDRTNVKFQFWYGYNNSTYSIGNGVEQNIQLTKKSYKQGEVSEEYQITLNDQNNLFGSNTDTIYLPLNKFEVYTSNNSAIQSNFLVEILPGSTFSFLPR